METKVAGILIVVAILCFFSSYYYNGNGQLGYKGLLFWKSIEKERGYIYKYSNRIFGLTLFVGSIAFFFLFGLAAKETKYLLGLRIAYLIYIFGSMLVADIFVAYKKSRENLR
ncbi:hypothetical protein M2139_001323 [Enterococcus sp. PF1-24]|uniref:hypothetical protein n=1 Tax=unclassified Enterococcus TaxID=2608891 RepID=UPI002472FDF5|nr:MULTISPECIES: hypothetical protein [unclassified Enterococcus]MDH6364372.1 hypothetical protein [Enterococcus sp. PFB1-1]MDH6401439.1 hypothetical protein [Enterococcus sp. PF1-24]